MNKQKIINYIKEVLAKNFVGNGVYSTRSDSVQIYNALMSINLDTEYYKMAALLKLIREKALINNKNLDDFIGLLDKEALKEEEEEKALVSNSFKEEVVADKPEEEIIINNNSVVDNNKNEEDNSESAKGNIMIFVISLLVLIIIILAVIIVLFC